MKYSTPAELILVGAGPGDPELLTVKAWRVLQQASTVLYDNLANPALLDLVPAGCEKVYVGKEPYGPTTSQERIHELIRDSAKKGGKIVRLKGGDPFVFGRGFEEVIYARELGLPVSYVPGISSMQASGLADIPLTHRGLSESIWIVTGTKKDGTLSQDLQLAMQSKATVVIYMGMKKLEEIAGAYQTAGMGELPAAIIQHATLPQERRAIGTAAGLPGMAAEHRLSHPAIIIIGEVVRFAKEKGGLSAHPDQLFEFLGVFQEFGQAEVRQRVLQEA
ncbi:MAG: uroporphyrinogen-III C-methyltransferase [Bacteroidetes bacterium]|nr:uroporphyrinogen-III C-methyltransferase [Bacteroidota bacterium]